MDDLTTVVTEVMQIEVMLVFGTAYSWQRDNDPPQLMESYWSVVWRWLDDRYPDLFVSSEFPTRWKDDAGHRRDMDVLMCIHSWQRAKEVRDEH